MRAAGSKHNGQTYGGVYYPAHSKNGKNISARWEAIMFLNKRGYTDNDGVKHEGKSETIRIVVWNSQRASAGKGMADAMAKCISVGKEISCGLDLNTFDKRLFINGQPASDPQGNHITYPAVNFKVTGDVIFGPDSEATVLAEIAAFNGQVNFSSRPPQWNVQNSADHAAWLNIVAARKAALPDPTKPNYGYARIVIPEGAVLTPLNAAPAGTNVVAGTNPTDAAATVLGANTVQTDTPNTQGNSLSL